MKSITIKIEITDEEFDLLAKIKKEGYIKHMHNESASELIKVQLLEWIGDDTIGVYEVSHFGEMFLNNF